ncbi:hypothetical protein NQ315_009694 [Exocentrus adspersus]|uniref:Uncharacterized protein n=1 Tax=Exocentrus adspersus TaxID=1586481 RepID=A0AAV8WI04_9CUCU|nr:hypothetical protein NQ315_009694 [Exocentrus adspersus]
MERTVLNYAPDYWNTSYTDLQVQFDLRSHSEEYKRIAQEVKQATASPHLQISFIRRNQNIHDYGQVLIREQLVTVSEGANYYRVRRYITILKHYLNCALDYNLDPRRCGKSSLIFQKYISRPTFNEIILVVQVITDRPGAVSIQPTNSSEYFIDYIVGIKI